MMHATAVGGELSFQGRMMRIVRGEILVDCCYIESKNIDIDLWAETNSPDVWTFRICPVEIRLLDSLAQLIGNRLHVYDYGKFEDDTLDTFYDSIRTSCMRPGGLDTIARETWCFQNLLMDFLSNDGDTIEAKFEATVGGTIPPGAGGKFFQYPLFGSILFRIDS